VSEVLYIQGLGEVEIVNWGDFVRKLGFLVGNELLNEIQDEALKMRLFDSGRYVRGMRFEQEGENLVFSNDAPYAPFLEYGTLEFGGSYSEDSWPVPPFSKKKDLSRRERERFPRGMQPFAPYRRVLYSEERVGRALQRLFG